MKIYTKVVMDWDGNVLEEDSYEYEGPVAQCGGGGGDTESTTNTVAEPWKGVQPYLSNLYGDVNKLYKAGMPEYYPGQTYINRDPLEDLAQQQNLAYSQQAMPGMIGDVQRTNQFMLSAPDAANNPYVTGMADTIERRLNRNLRENLYKENSDMANQYGQYGMDSFNIGKGIAERGTQEAYGDAMSQLYGDAYKAGLEQQRSGMALAPQSIQMGMAPSEIMGQVGAYNRGEQELALQEDMSRYQYNTGSPYENIGWANQMYMGAPWGGSSTSQMDGTSRSPLMGALGGAMMGASAAPMLGGMFAGASSAMGPSALLASGMANPLFLPLALGGGLLGSGIL